MFGASKWRITMKLLLKNRGALLLLILNLFLMFTGIGLIVPILPKFMNEMGVTGSIAGLLVAAFSLTQFLFSPVAGRLADRFGRKRMIVSGMLVFALSEWLFGVANDTWLLFVARMLGGVSGAMIMPAVMAYAADITTPEERAAGMGYINAAISTGFIIGPGIGGYLATFGLRVPFYIAAVAGLVAALATFLLLKERSSSTVQEEAPSQQGPRISLWTQLRMSYREPYFFSLILVFVMSFGLANFETIFGLFVDHKFGFGPDDIAFILTFGSIAGAVVQVTAFSWILKTFGEKRVISACLLVAAIFVLLVLFAHKFWIICAFTFIIFLATDILRPTISTQMSMLAKDQQGYVAGLNSAFTSLGNIIGPIVAGVLLDANVNAPYVLASVVLLLSFLLSVRARKGRKPGEKKVPAIS
ncbi:MFS transporter [Gorillibacterium sp. CAU 1737]|uniref:MFS transporter n=1 Tax=Gorillibacterium sp. CAU 1737 TaxID=3140362 RepID=UPI003260E9BD